MCMFRECKIKAGYYIYLRARFAAYCLASLNANCTAGKCIDTGLSITLINGFDLVYHSKQKEKFSTKKYDSFKYRCLWNLLDMIKS